MGKITVSKSVSDKLEAKLAKLMVKYVSKQTNYESLSYTNYLNNQITKLEEKNDEIRIRNENQNRIIRDQCKEIATLKSDLKTKKEEIGKLRARHASLEAKFDDYRRMKLENKLKMKVKQSLINQTVHKNQSVKN